MDIEKRKAEMIAKMELVKQDCDRLKHNCDRGIELLSHVHTDDDGMEFDRVFDIEEGLNAFDPVWKFDP